MRKSPCAMCAATRCSTSRSSLKERKITEDEERKAEEDIQKLTDKAIKDVDVVVKAKEDELMALERRPESILETVTSASDAGASSARLPRHVAIVMDGNGRWARKRLRPRSSAIAGRRRRPCAARSSSVCAAVAALTLFAFSSENWQRPSDEVGASDGTVPAKCSIAKSRNCTAMACASASLASWPRSRRARACSARWNARRRTTSSR